MRRKNEEPLELPLLEVVYLPGDPIPAMVILPGDFEVSGEIHIATLTTTQQLIELQRLLIFVLNHVADVIWSREQSIVPFEVTGGRSPDGEAPTE